MLDWQYDLLQAAKASTDPNPLFAQVRRIAERLGFEYVAYGSRQLFPLCRERLFLVNNYSEAWREAYAAGGYFGIDPYVRRSLESPYPVLWDDALRREAPAFWEEARSHGLVEGWGQALQAHGRQGLVTFARSAEPISVRELKAIQASLCWLGQLTHLGMSRVQRAQGDACQIRLSAQEKEVLRWTADGKSTEEIAMILAISARTVNFHIQSCLRKLDCQNKTAAAVKACLLDLLG